MDQAVVGGVNLSLRLLFGVAEIIDDRYEQHKSSQRVQYINGDKKGNNEIVLSFSPYQTRHTV